TGARQSRSENQESRIQEPVFGGGGPATLALAIQLARKACDLFDLGSICRALLPAMACKATDLADSTQLAINVFDHLDHLPGYLFIVLVVLFPLILDMAKRAFNT